jgi:hypothetical protein
MDEFLNTYDHTKLNKEDIKNLNWSTTGNEIEATTNSFPKRKSVGPYGFTTEFYFKRPLK